MSNFGFLRDTLPQLHRDCARAEDYLAADPVAWIYARKASSWSR